MGLWKYTRQQQFWETTVSQFTNRHIHSNFTDELFVSNKPRPAHRPLFWITTPLPIKYLLPLVHRSGGEGKNRKPSPEGHWTPLYTKKQLRVCQNKGLNSILEQSAQINKLASRKNEEREEQIISQHWILLPIYNTLWI